MEKTNELNKFLSYIHMGNTIYRIYYKEAKKLNNKKLTDLIVEIQEKFKTHEETISGLIQKLHGKPNESLTFVGTMGVYKEKLKSFPNAFAICKSAIQATHMGMISSLKFLDNNKELSIEIKRHIIKVIDDYGNIINKLKEFILQTCQ